MSNDIKQLLATNIYQGLTNALTAPSSSNPFVTAADNTPTKASYQASPSDPATTTSSAGVMMGLAGSITPVSSGKVLIIISGDYDNAIGDAGCAVQMRTGTGTAPTNGSALTGTARGGLVTMSIVASSTTTAVNRTPFCLNYILTGSVATTYWVDISLAIITGGTARARNISISIVEQ